MLFSPYNYSIILLNTLIPFRVKSVLNKEKGSLAADFLFAVLILDCQ